MEVLSFPGVMRDIGLWRRCEKDISQWAEEPRDLTGLRSVCSQDVWCCDLLEGSRWSQSLR